MLGRRFDSLFPQSFMLLLVMCLLTPVLAQNSIEIKEADRVPLKEKRHPMIRRENEAGRTNPHLRMRPMVLFLASPAGPARGAAAEFFPAGPRDFGSWGAKPGRVRSGGADQSLQVVTNWLRSHGLVVEPGLLGPAAIRFQGTVAQVEEAFRVKIRNYVVKGKPYYANASPPSIPRALSRSIRAVDSLGDLPMESGAAAAGSPEITISRVHGDRNAACLCWGDGQRGQPLWNDVWRRIGWSRCRDQGGQCGQRDGALQLHGDEQVTAHSPDGTALILDSAGNLYGTTYRGGADRLRHRVRASQG